MLNSEFPISYDNICMNVRHTLLDYENYEANIPRKEIEQSLNKMYSKQDKIREKLDIAESNSMGIVGEWESFNQWFSVLKESNEEMEHKEKDDETELGRLRLAFSSNANQLKSLEGDILCCCRKLPDTKESPQVIRLKCVYSKAKEYFTERSQILSEIDEEMKIAEEKFEDASKENSTLTEQNSQFEKQLALFSNSESFKLVQDARKHILIKKEWSEKKSKLMSDIQNSTKELENYLGNKDQSLRNLVLEGNKQDQEASKLQSKYNEMIQDIINEDNISNTNRATVMKQLHIELDRLKQNQLRKESNITRNEVRTLKNKGDRLVSKMKMEVSNSSRTFSQALSKLTEPKPITEKTANFSRFRNVKGKRKKKSPKKKDSLAPKEPPPRVYSLHELAMMKLQEDKEKYALFLKSKFEPEINELRGFLERKINIHDELLQQELSEILAADKRQRDILMANKIRIQQRISEKEIEISSLNTELATFEDMVHDYQQNCVSLEKKNEELKKKSLEIIDPSKFIELRKNIESLDSFIEHTKDYINFLNAKMEDRIENSNQTKCGVKYTDNISYAKNLTRSKSMNDILHADQKAFKKPKVETKRPRVDSALLLASLSKYESKPAKISTEPKAPVKSEQTHSIQSSTTEKVESIEKVEITLRSINSNVFVNNSRDDFVVASTINTKKDDRITNVINNNDRVVIETKIEQKETEKQVCLVAENAAASVGDKEEIDKKVESSFAPKEPSKSDKEEENLSTHHFTRFAAIESSTVNELHSHEIIAKKAPSAQPREKEKEEAIQPPPEQIIAVNNNGGGEEEEADLIVPESITKVQTEEPQLNVTQPPSCQASTSKPQSQLQMPIQPPLEQADFIRKAPTLGTDMRAFTIEARVSPPTSQTGRRVPTQQTQIPNNFLLNAFSRGIEIEHEMNVYQKMIDQSTDTYKMVGESEKLQLHERKPRKMTKKTKQQKNADPLVLFSVTPLNQSSNLKTSMNVNSAQINKFDGQVVSVGNLTARRKRGVSATPLNNVPLRKENRFMIYAAGEQQSKKPIVFGARRRAMIESDNNENVYSNCINKVSIRKQKINNKVNITAQRRRNSTINRGIKTK